MVAGVMRSAATTMSASFSRCASSSTSTGSPAATAAMTSGIGDRGMTPSSSAAGKMSVVVMKRSCLWTKTLQGTKD